MRKIKFNKTGRIAIRLLLVSLGLILLARLITDGLFYFNINSKIGEIIYLVCYTTGFAAILLFLVSLITLAIQILIRPKKDSTKI